MMNIAKAIFGGLMLILGRDMDWLFSLGLGLLVGLNASTLLAPDSPPYMVYVVIIAVALISVLPYLVYPESSYVVTGFLFGGFVLSEYGNDLLRTFLGTGLSGSPWIIFFVGAVVGALVLGLAKEWGVMFATALAGAFLVAGIFAGLSPVARYLVAGGLFIAGSIIQAVIHHFEQAGER